MPCSIVHPQEVAELGSSAMQEAVMLLPTCNSSFNKFTHLERLALVLSRAAVPLVIRSPFEAQCTASTLLNHLCPLWDRQLVHHAGDSAEAGAFGACRSGPR